MQLLSILYIIEVARMKEALPDPTQFSTPPSCDQPNGHPAAQTSEKGQKWGILKYISSIEQFDI